MKFNFLFLFYSLCFYRLAIAQTPEPMRSFPVEDQVAVSADTQGNIYISTRDGEIKKYTSAGLLLNTFSPQTAGYFSILDASSSLQIKAFNENSQTIVYLDRFLNQTSSFQLPPEQFNFLTALCWSAGNTIWAADAVDLQLKRWSLDTHEVVLTLNLSQYITDERLEIRMLREHQHKLYLFSSNQLYIFDQMGNYEQQLPLLNWKSATFSENEIIFLEKDKLRLLHLYSSQQRSIPLPENASKYQQLVYSKGEIYLFSLRKADVYPLRP